jgi:ABC-type multidrug transport system fused ATPase/permease subunit
MMNKKLETKKNSPERDPFASPWEAPDKNYGAASPLAIELCQLRCVYGTKVAVDNLSLHVPFGSVYGFLGPNGAGKTTTIKTLLGLRRMQEGNIGVALPCSNFPVIFRLFNSL